MHTGKLQIDMSKVVIETLTPVHIGSGYFFQSNTDFVVTSTGEWVYLRIVDAGKILALIGDEHLNDWLLSIERKENTKELIKRYAPQAKPADYSTRRILCFSGVSRSDTLKECVHDGRGLAYIPGSSIKGAIRTALLSSVVNSISGKEGKILKGNTKISAALIEAELFGKDPGTDIFRFLQVGDAYFGKDCEIASRMIDLNLRRKEDLLDHSKPQLVEAIGINEKSSFNLKLAKDHYLLARKNDLPINDIPIEMESLSDLFRTINNHTRTLVESEIEIWTDISATKTGAEVYLDNLKSIFELIASCKEGVSCVLRIGHASGWRFITGAWAEELSNFDDIVVPASRPNNHYYSEYDFPKSRRLDEDGDVFGFVKLTLAD